MKGSALTLKNILVNALYYGVTLAALPSAALDAESRLGSIWHPHPALKVVAALLGLGGVVLQVWCVALLQRWGGGTPSPAAPTRRLVTEGPYRWVRNPLNLGELMLLGALALWFASWTLAVYVLLAGVAFHAFVVYWEEPRHRRLFGDSYLAYAARVARWLPRRRPRPGASS